ncbi:Metallo-dependent phosphatase-like protein [Chytriomyces sp. MP71]|nr:Metallo-dependent phosphatase-like protein [Chytriomyces sp. MP71]
MEQWASEHQSSGIISLGDNFYLGGSFDYEGVLNATDPKFNRLWTDVYNGITLQSLPWLIVLGNHDWYTLNSPQSQFDFQHPNWFLPDLFYTRRIAVSNGYFASFVFIETDLLQYGYPANGKNATDMARNFAAFGWSEENQTIEKQLAWIDQALEAANKDHFVFVVGHHGGFNCAQDVIQSVAMPRLVSLLDKWRVSAMLHGHHHTLAYHKSGSTLHVQSGSGGNISPECAPVDPTAEGAELGNTYGFVHMMVSRWESKFEFVTESGEVAMTTSISPREPVVGVQADVSVFDLMDIDPAVHYRRMKATESEL